jgi:proton-dependent oligopeptide transporter, POT family
MNNSQLGCQNRQPKALFLLVFVQMWECFSFYGMRALLVLYMIHELQFNDITAFGVYAIYTGLVELGGVLGGLVAEKVLGLRRAIVLGGLLIAAGHLTIAIDTLLPPFFIGLALLVVGSSLFNTNISALLGLFYQEDDPKREEGFTLFYVGINVGALLATLVCGAVGELYGWHYGFGLAAIGMLIGNLALFAFQNILEGKGEPPANRNKNNERGLLSLIIPIICIVAFALAQARWMMLFLPLFAILALAYVTKRLLLSEKVETAKIIKLLSYLGGFILIYATSEQIGSSLLVFSERMAEPLLFGITIPSAIVLSINPLTVILFGSFINRLVRVFNRPHENHSERLPKRIAYAFVIAALAFGLLAMGCLQAESSQASISMGVVLSSVFLISISELFIGPFLYSYCSEIASKSEQSTVMSFVPIGFSLSSFVGGIMSQSMAISEGGFESSLAIYGVGFAWIAILLIGTIILMMIGVPFILYLVNKNRNIEEII